GVLVPSHREGRYRHAGSQGVRERRPQRTTGKAEVLQRCTGRRSAVGADRGKGAGRSSEATSDGIDRRISAAVSVEAAVHLRVHEVRKAVLRPVNLARRTVRVYQGRRERAAGAL